MDDWIDLGLDSSRCVEGLVSPSAWPLSHVIWLQNNIIGRIALDSDYANSVSVCRMELGIAHEVSAGSPLIEQRPKCQRASLR